MEKERLFEIIDRLSKKEKLLITKEEYKELIELFENNNSQLINSWIEIKRQRSETFNTLDSKVLESALNNIKGVIEKRELPKKIFRKYFKFIERAAAILFIPLTILSVYLLSFNKPEERYHSQNTHNIIDSISSKPGHSQEFISPAGTRSKIILSDSTEIFLNSSSNLSLTSLYGVEERRVKLTGQAYFKVKTNRELPFIVELKEGLKIKVTGTTFVVNAYPENKKIETVLLSGSVELLTNNSSVEMKPSQIALFDVKDQKVMISSGGSSDKFELWKDGILVFDETTMSDVKSILEKWYNINITIDNQAIMSFKFTGRLDNCSLSQVLDYISYSSQIKYVINDRNVKLSLNEN